MTDPLYPIPENVEATRFILSRARRERDERGRMLLPALLTAAEREMVQRRLHELAAPLKEAKRAEVARELLAIFPDVEADVAKARAKSLAEGMDGLPLFAVRRAALQISQRSAAAPDRMALRTEAENVARPYWNEASIGSLLLRARKNPASTPSDAERARIEAGFAALLGQLAAGTQEGPDGEKARRRRTKRIIREDRARRERDYRGEGLEPVFADKGRNIVVSLPMLEKVGYRVEEIRGERVLVRPDGRRHRQEEDAE